MAGYESIIVVPEPAVPVTAEEITVMPSLPNTAAFDHSLANIGSVTAEQARNMCPYLGSLPLKQVEALMSLATIGNNEALNEAFKQSPTKQIIKEPAKGNNAPESHMVTVGPAEKSPESDKHHSVAKFDVQPAHASRPSPAPVPSESMPVLPVAGEPGTAPTTAGATPVQLGHITYETMPKQAVIAMPPKSITALAMATSSRQREVSRPTYLLGEQAVKPLVVKYLIVESVNKTQANSKLVEPAAAGRLENSMSQYMNNPADSSEQEQIESVEVCPSIYPNIVTVPIDPSLDGVPNTAAALTYTDAEPTSAAGEGIADGPSPAGTLSDAEQPFIANTLSDELAVLATAEIFGHRSYDRQRRIFNLAQQAPARRSDLPIDTRSNFSLRYGNAEADESPGTEQLKHALEQLPMPNLILPPIISDEPVSFPIGLTVRHTVETSVAEIVDEQLVQETFEQLQATVEAAALIRSERLDSVAEVPLTDEDSIDAIIDRILEPGVVPSRSFESVVQITPEPVEPIRIDALIARGDGTSIEKTLIKLSQLALTEEDLLASSSDDAAAIIESLWEIAEILPDHKTNSHSLEANSPELTRDLTEKILLFLSALGYAYPQEALVKFVATYDLDYLLEALQYLCQLYHPYFQLEARRQCAVQYIPAQSSRTDIAGRIIMWLWQRGFTSQPLHNWDELMPLTPEMAMATVLAN